MMLPTSPLWTPSGWRDKDETISTIKSPARVRLIAYLNHNVGALSVVVAHVVERERGFGREWMRRRDLEERLLLDFQLFINGIQPFPSITTAIADAHAVPRTCLEFPTAVLFIP